MRTVSVSAELLAYSVGVLLTDIVLEGNGELSGQKQSGALIAVAGASELL